MYDSTEKVLLDKNIIAKRVAELGEQITKDFEGESVVVVGILKGSAPFMTDLIREIDLPMDIDFMVVSSYENDKSSGIVKIIKDININAEGKNIIIVEDIVENQEVEEETVETSIEENLLDEYFTTTKLQRDTMYSQIIESYQKMLDSTTITTEQKAIAQNEITKINNIKNAIMIAENLIKTKGFEDVIILVNEPSVNVILDAEELNQEQIAQVQNIISREMKAEIENIHISNK